MVSILATSNPGAQNNAPSITLPVNIPAGTNMGYILVTATSVNVPIDMPGWTIKDGPQQSGQGVGLAYVFQKPVTAADSGTTVTGTITTTGSPRWAAMCVVAVDAVEDSITYAGDTSADTTVNIPGFTPNSANAMAVTIGGATVLSGLGHATWTQATGDTKVIDSGSSFGTLNEVNVFASRRTLTSAAGVAVAAATSTMTQSVRANVWVLTFKAPTVAPTAQHVGGSVGSSPTTSVNGPTMTFPAGKAAGDIAVLSGAWNQSTVAVPTIPAGWTMLGSVHVVASTMSVATWTKTLTAGETSVVPTFSVAARGGFTLDVWRGAVPQSVAYTDAATVTTQTNNVPAITGLSGGAVFTTAWFERSGVDTTVTVPAGTTLVDATFPTGSGSVQAAVAYNATRDTDGSVGSGSWARGNISPATSANTTVATVAMLISAPPPAASSGRFRWNGTAWIAQNTSRL